MAWCGVATDRWGIDDGYRDWSGEWHDAAPGTIEALRAAMGEPQEPATPLWCVTPGEQHRFHGRADLVLEDGTTLEAQEALPPDLPLGYHQLVPHDGGPVTSLVVTPRRCPAPEPGWGLAVQLYAARSERSWGIGDLADLRRLSAWARGHGASVLLLNPLGATAPVPPQQPSPYYPSSRLFRSLLYLRVEDVPGAARLGEGLAEVAARGRALNRERHIDRDAVIRLKLDALRRLWALVRDDDVHRRGLDAYRRSAGAVLDAFAVHAALTERHGPGWPAWPAELRHPHAPAVRDAARELADDVAFHAWCQWLVDEQLGAAMHDGVRVLGDLPVGFDPGGFDAWWYQDDLALGCRIGAPPDEFNTAGQDWGLPPFVPWRLRARAFEPLVTTVRAALRHVQGVRIDHVMGLFRLYWIPEGAPPTAGTYVRYHWPELLDLLALEAHRAGCFVVGEDLGTVEDEVREALGERGVLSTRLVWFEEGPPEAFPEQALASLTTHDLPTVAGVWTGADEAVQRAAGVPVNEEGAARVRERLARLAGVPLPEDPSVSASARSARGAADVHEVVVRAHRRLGEARSRLVLATLDDLCEVPERPNLPGTVDEAPNWRLALPRPLEALEDDPAVVEVLRALAEGRARAASGGTGDR